MTDYVLFNRMTGEIIQTGSCPTDDYLLLESESIGVIVAEADLSSNYVNVSTGEVVIKPERPSQWHQWDWGGYQWVVDLPVARAARATLISTACKSAIIAGFESLALGASHHYPAKATDQQNLASSVLASLLPIPADWTTPFWCADTNGVWAFRLHTASQIQLVGQDAKTAILYAMARNEQLQAVIDAATTLAELEVITW